ncbi:MAG: hypothetical protein ABR889_09175 [Acidobacteriaceae bacterium]
MANPTTPKARDEHGNPDDEEGIALPQRHTMAALKGNAHSRRVYEQNRHADPED